jgi:hypothetical protein
MGLAADFAGTTSASTIGDRLNLAGSSRNLIQLSVDLTADAGVGGFEGNETADFNLYLYAVGNGADGIPDTKDDTVGLQLGYTITLDNHPISATPENLIFSLPGFVVPGSLIVAIGLTDIKNFDNGEGITWDLVPSPTDPIGTSDPFFLYQMARGGTGLSFGLQGSNPIGSRPDSNLSFEIMAIPEPASGCLLLFGIGIRSLFKSRRWSCL